MRYEVRKQVMGVAEERWVVWDTIMNKPAYKWSSGQSQMMHFGIRVRADICCRDMNAHGQQL